MRKLLLSCFMCLMACNMAMAEKFNFANMSINKSLTDYSDENFTRGTISYDFDNNVLTLNNVDITFWKNSTLIFIPDEVKDFTIKLIGENRVVSDGSFLAHSAAGNVTIEGTGSLDANLSYNRGIVIGDWSNGGESSLTVKDCNIKIKTDGHSIVGSQADTEDKGVLTVTFDNAYAELYGYSVTTWMTFYYPAITAIKDVILENCTYTEPSAPYIGKYFGTNSIVEDVDGETCGVQKLVISPNSVGIRQQSVNSSTAIKRVNNLNQLEIERNGHIYNVMGIRLR